MKRRDFTKLVSNSVAGTSLLTLGLFSACSKDDPASPSGDDPNAPFKMNLVDTPELADVGGVTSLVANGIPLTIFRLTDEGFITFSRVCPHQSCTLEWQPDDERFECPCHESMFDKNGNVLSGPANRRLTTFDTTYDSKENLLVITF